MSEVVETAEVVEAVPEQEESSPAVEVTVETAAEENTEENTEEATANSTTHKKSRLPKFLTRKKKDKKDKKDEERPADASKLSCGGLFSCASRQRDPDKAPKEKKPEKIKTGKSEYGTVKENGEPVADDAGKFGKARLASLEDICCPTETDDSTRDEEIEREAHRIVNEVVNEVLKDTPENQLSESVPADENSVGVEECEICPQKSKNVQAMRLLDLAKTGNHPDQQHHHHEHHNHENEQNQQPENHTPDASQPYISESQRRQSERQKDSYKPVVTSEVKLLPGSVLDQAANREMWQNIVNKSLVGTTLLTKAAIVNQDTGGIFACNPSDFTPTVEQVTFLRSGIHDPGQLATPGIQVAEETFHYSSGSPGEFVFGENSATDSGIAVYRTKTALLIGIYHGNGDAAKGLCKDIAEYISDQGL